MANANTWTALQTFAYSSSTSYSSFITASTTNGYFGTLSLNGTDLQTSLNAKQNTISTAVNSVLSTDASGNIVATSTPTFGYFNATSTNATSTIAGGLNIENGGFVYDYSSGNVGIGTAAPRAKLHVSGNIALPNAGQIQFDDGTGTYIKQIAEAGNGLEFYAGSVGSVKAIDISGAGTTQIGSAWFAGNLIGAVGIGTTTPTNKLTIADSAASQLSLSDSAGIAQWAFRNAGGNLYFATTTVAGTATTTTSALSILGSSGYVGIGTANPGGIFEVFPAGAGRTRGALLVNDKNVTIGVLSSTP